MAEDTTCQSRGINLSPQKNIHRTVKLSESQPSAQRVVYHELPLPRIRLSLLDQPSLRPQFLEDCPDRRCVMRRHHQSKRLVLRQPRYTFTNARIVASVCRLLVRPDWVIRVQLCCSLALAFEVRPAHQLDAQRKSISTSRGHVRL
jgi:hypothetical protein